MSKNIWEMIHKEKDWGKYPSENIIRFIAQNYYSVLKRDKVRILEIGCGVGSNLWFCAKEGFEVHGIDISKTAIKKCYNRFDEEISNWKGKIRVGDLSSINYEDNFFDAIIDNECLSCISYNQTKIVLSEVKRVLKSGGKLISVAFATSSKIHVSKNELSFKEVSPLKGPLSNNGTVRLIDEIDINTLYGAFLKVDKYEIVQKTTNNREYNVVEYVIQCSK